MTKALTTTQQGGKILFLLGWYQASLGFDLKLKVWVAEYFNKNRQVLTSSSSNHPVMPRSLSDQSRAEEITSKVMDLLHTGKPITKDIFSPAPKARKVPTRSKTSKKVVTPFQVLDRLLNLVDNTGTVLVPMGTPASLKTSKVRIVDSEGETLCEIPYPIFETLL